MSKLRSLFAVAALAAVSFAAVGCEKDTFPLTPVAPANLMAIHASPNAPGVDLYVDNVKQNSSALTFPNKAGYLSVPAGTRNVKVNAAGTATTVINADLNLAGGASYSVFAYDSLSKIKPLVLTDDLATPAAGKAHVRFVHLSPDAPAVNIVVQGGPTLFSNIAFGGSTAFTPVDVATYTLEVRTTVGNTLVLTVPGVAVADRKIYTIWASGFAGGTPALAAQIIANN
jgi:hypothetical protein